jgi:uncharacterized membrane protein YhaH (DUF805 family)
MGPLMQKLCTFTKRMQRYRFQTFQYKNLILVVLIMMQQFVNTDQIYRLTLLCFHLITPQIYYFYFITPNLLTLFIK